MVRWVAAQGAAQYRVRILAEDSARTLVDEQVVSTGTEIRAAKALADRTGYSVEIVAEDAADRAVAPPAVARFVTLLLPDWMPRMELVRNDPAFVQPGYRLVNLLDIRTPKGVSRVAALALVNEAGEVVWYYQLPGAQSIQAPKVLNNGNLLFVAQRAENGRTLGTCYEMTWDGKLGWQSRPDVVPHHDIGLGPDGGYLYMTWLWQPVGNEIYEGDGLELVDPASGRIMWSWSLFDHFPPAQWPTPEAKTTKGLSGVGQDWSHANAAVWDPSRQMIWLSVRHFDALVGIRYPSGDVGVILGKRGIGGEGLMSHQHAPEIQEDGTILLYDNGNGYTPPFTRVTRIRFDEPAGVAEIVYEWRDQPDFYDFAVGDANRLANGNILVTAGISGRLIEVVPGRGIVWESRFVDNTRWWAYRTELVPESLVDPSVLPRLPR
jgi:hypothetical protein